MARTPAPPRATSGARLRRPLCTIAIAYFATSASFVPIVAQSLPRPKSRLIDCASAAPFAATFVGPALATAAAHTGGGGSGGGGGTFGRRHTYRPEVTTISAAKSFDEAEASCTATNEMNVENEMYPNWRVYRRSPDESRSSSSSPSSSRCVSPFCHSNTSDAPTSAAPWSNDAYREALELHDRFVACTDSFIGPLIRDALHVLEQAYRLYGPYSVVGSYNGGKDAVVILHLMRAAHAKFHRDEEERKRGKASGDNEGESEPESEPEPGSLLPAPRPRVIYFDHADEFPEVTDLLRSTVKKFDLDMVAFQQGIKFGEGLKVLVDTNHVPNNVTAVSEHRPTAPPHPMAFVLGTRTSDPNAGSQGKFAPSSHYMPPFMRVNPILEWNYGHVWHFLRLFGLPYCSLYDRGYTSLGTVKDTLPCPALAKPPMETSNAPSKGDCDEDDDDFDGKGGGDASGQRGGEGDAEEFWPAYMLRDWDQERAGRISSKPTQPKTPTMSQSSSTVSLHAKESKCKNTAGNEVGDLADITDDDDDGGGIDDIDDSSIGSAHRRQRTVGLIVIGDEILKGLTSDTNTRAAASALHEHNVPLAKVAIVSDDKNEISREISRMRDETDVVVTSGGVGPTHDDVTMKSVAAALGREMVLHGEMAELLARKMRHDGGSSVGNESKRDDGDGDGALRQENELTEAQIKMSTLPLGSRLRYLTKDVNDDWPVLQCGPVFVLPGVPQFFEKKIKALAEYLSSELERSVAYRVVLSVDETRIVQVLNLVVRRHPNVSFGSYPFVGHPETKTVVTLEGRLIEGGYTRNSGRFLERSRSASSSSGSWTTTTTTAVAASSGGKMSQGPSSVVPPSPLLFTKEEMDLNVKKALSDLLRGLPEGSVLRVDDSDDLSFN